jgi:hypothetical protein
MAISSGPHHKALKMLTPKRFAPEGNFNKVLLILGKHFDEKRTIAQELLVEFFPDTTRSADESTYGLLEWWERTYGLVPPTGATYNERRAALLAQYRAVGGLNKEYFKGLASAFGFKIFPPPGDGVPNEDETNPHDLLGDPHLRITDGDFPMFRADISYVDMDIIWDQGEGQATNTWCVLGTDVESHFLLQDLFEKLKPLGTSILFINE